MNLFVKLCAVLSVCIVLTSCGDIHEDIYVSKAAGGTYNIKSDVLSMMKQMTKMQGGGEDAAEGLWQQMGGESIDSTIDLTDRFTDEQKANEKLMRIVKNAKIYMRGSKAEDKLEMGLNYTFDNVADLNELGSLSREMQDENSMQQVSLPGSATKVYKQEANKFIIEDKGANALGEMNLSMKDEMMVKMMVKNADYISTIHSKDKIKKASGDGLVKFNDSVAIFKYDFKKMLQGKQKQNVVIEFK
jgi:hypothetical protein